MRGDPDPCFPNRSGSAGRPGGSCGFLSGSFGLLGKSGFCGRSGWYGRTLGGVGRSVKFFAGRFSFGLGSDVGRLAGGIFRVGIVCTGGSGGGLLSRREGGSSGGPFSTLALLLVFFTACLGEFAGPI